MVYVCIFFLPPPTTEQHGAVFTAMMGFESYRLNSISKSFPLKHNEAQRSTLQKARCLILWVAKYFNLNYAAHQHLFANRGGNVVPAHASALNNRVWPGVFKTF